MPDLSVTVDGLRLPNPFLIASGPPGTNAGVIAKAFDEGWGAVIAKTVCLDASKIVNVAPRYARLRAGPDAEVIGWENIELISDRPLDTWLAEFRDLKRRYPGRVLIASVMEEYRRDAWREIIDRCQAAGVDALELNFSCPHGLPERRMGSAMGQDPAILEEVCGWAREAASIPLWAKLTPNITRIDDAARAALRAGCNGVSAINTILSVMNINLDTLRPEPTVAGYSIPGGYSARAIRPIALRMVMECATMMHGRGGPAPIEAEFPARSLSAVGGIESGEDAAQYLLLGASTTQVCTGVMLHGYGLIHRLAAGLTAFMRRHRFERIDDFRGRSLSYFTTHADLVARQARARAEERASARPHVVTRDHAWAHDRLVEQSRSLSADH